MENNTFRFETAAMARWFERPPRERQVMGSIPCRDRPQSLKLVAVASPLGTEDYGNRPTTDPPLSG